MVEEVFVNTKWNLEEISFYFTITSLILSLALRVILPWSLRIEKSGPCRTQANILMQPVIQFSWSPMNTVNQIP